MLTAANEIATQILHRDLDGDHAVKVSAACFTDEAGQSIDFFRLWGETIRRTYNPANTITTYHFVKGESLEEFNLHCP